MEKIKSFLSAMLVMTALLTPSASLMGWDLCNWSDCCNSLDFAVEGRVAYYRPSSGKVREIYGDGWTDYEVQISTGFCRDWRVWVGVNGFSREGESICFHDHTDLQFVPITFGVKYFPPFFPMCEEFKFFIGAGGCYSFLNIKDDYKYVHHHTHKEGWGGLIEAGVNYYFWRGAYVSLFVDGFFQEFGFHNSYISSSGSSCPSSEIIRDDLDMSGFRLGVGIGYRF